MKTVFAALAVAGLAASASATVLYSTSFEAPTFAVGGLSGQDGWTAASNPATLFQVGSQAGFARTGSQYAWANSALATGNGSQWNFRPSNISPISPPASIIRASVYTAMVDNTTVAVRRATSSGIDLWDDVGNRLGGIRIRNDGQIGVLNSLGQLATTPVGAVVGLNTWNQVAVEADFALQTVRFFVNGFELGVPAGFGNFSATGFGDADLYMFRAFTGTTGQAQSGGHTVLWDDFNLERIPTPGSVSVLALAGLVAARRRRA